MDEAKRFVDLLGKAIEKGLYDSTQLSDGEGSIPMRAAGAYSQGDRYERGDVVYVQGVGLFVAKRSTIANPVANGADDWLVVMAQGSGGGGAQLAPLTYRVENITPIVNGQTVFSLPATPQLPASVVMSVNGADYFQFGDFALAGTTATWANMFTISAADRVVFKYV